MISNKKLKGISLITLVITIVVVIILAAAVLLSLSKNNPIDNARIANLTQSKDSIESGILAYTSKIKAKTLAEFETEDIILGNNEKIENNRIIEKESDNYKSVNIGTNTEIITLYKIDKAKYEENIDNLPRTPNTESSWYIDKEGKVYLAFESIDKVPNWMKSKDEKIDNATLNTFVTFTEGAKKVAGNVEDYYGKVVENYNAQDMEWKIFHSDGKNIYLITSEYIDLSLLPEPAEGGTKPVNTNSSYPKAAPLTNVLNGYSRGSEEISPDNLAIRWLKSYFVDNNYVSRDNNNMKAVAYMLDTEKWSEFVNDEYANYAIGGPTVEMLFASYNKKHTDVNYRAEAKGAIGYLISQDGGKNWANSYSGMLSTSDTLYVLPSSSKAIAMWVASPSYSNRNYLMGVSCSRCRRL